MNELEKLEQAMLEAAETVSGFDMTNPLERFSEASVKAGRQMTAVADLAEARRKRAQKAEDEAYKKALAKILDRAKKLDW